MDSVPIRKNNENETFLTILTLSLPPTLSSMAVVVVLCVCVGWRWEAKQVGLFAGCAALIALRSLVLFYLSAFLPAP